MTPPKPASPCEHSQKKNSWMKIIWHSENHYESQWLSKTTHPACPFCKPAQKPVSSCCGAPIIHQIGFNGFGSGYYECSKCEKRCQKLVDKPAEGCEHDELNKWAKYSENGAFHRLDYIYKKDSVVCPFCNTQSPGKAETQDVGEIADNIITEIHNLTPSTKARAKRAITEAIERERAKAAEKIKELTVFKEQKIAYDRKFQNGIYLTSEVYKEKCEKIAVLEQKLAQAEKQSEIYRLETHRWSEAYKPLNEKAKELEAKLAAKQEALEKFGRHEPMCLISKAIHGGRTFPEICASKIQCTCGLDKAKEKSNG